MDCIIMSKIFSFLVPVKSVIDLVFYLVWLSLIDTFKRLIGRRVSKTLLKAWCLVEINSRKKKFLNFNFNNIH